MTLGCEMLENQMKNAAEKMLLTKEKETLPQAGQLPDSVVQYL